MRYINTKLTMRAAGLYILSILGLITVDEPVQIRDVMMLEMCYSRSLCFPSLVK